MSPPDRVLGVVLPANNQVLVPEVWEELKRSGIELACRRIPVSAATSDEVERMAVHARDAIIELAEDGVDAIVYACMWTSLVVDEEWDRELAQFARRIGGVDLDTAFAALCRSLDECSATRICVLTAYPRPVHEQMCGLLAGRRHHVTAEGTLDLTDFGALARVGPEDLLALADQSLAGAEVEALCVLGTDLPSRDAVPRLAERYHVPVITSNGAIAAAARRLLGDGLHR